MWHKRRCHLKLSPALLEMLGYIPGKVVEWRLKCYPTTLRYLATASIIPEVRYLGKDTYLDTLLTSLDTGVYTKQ